MQREVQLHVPDAVDDLEPNVGLDVAPGLAIGVGHGQEQVGATVVTGGIQEPADVQTLTRHG